MDDIEEVKWLLFYGHNKDETIDIRNGDIGNLDLAFYFMFESLKTSGFDIEKVERAFWNRLQSMINLTK